MAHKRPADLPSRMQHNLKIHCASLEEAGNLCSSFPRVSSCNKKFSSETLWAGSASPPVPGPFAAHKARQDAGALTLLHLASPHAAASTGLDLQSKLYAPGLAPQTLEDATQWRSLFPSPVPHGPGSMCDSQTPSVPSALLPPSFFSCLRSSSRQAAHMCSLQTQQAARQTKQVNFPSCPSAPWYV